MKKIIRAAFAMLIFTVCLIIGSTAPFGGTNALAGEARDYVLTELGGNEYGYNSLNEYEKRLFDAIGE